MKLVKCKDCGDSKEILIEIDSFQQTFQCKVCYNEEHPPKEGILRIISYLLNSVKIL